MIKFCLFKCLTMFEYLCQWWKNYAVTIKQSRDKVLCKTSYYVKTRLVSFWNLKVLLSVLFNNTLSPKVSCDIGYLYEAIHYLFIFILLYSSVYFEEMFFFLLWYYPGLCLGSCNSWTGGTRWRRGQNELAEACDPASQQCVFCKQGDGYQTVWMFYRKAWLISLNRLGCRRQTTPPFTNIKLKEWRA